MSWLTLLTRRSERMVTTAGRDLVDEPAYDAPAPGVPRAGAAAGGATGAADGRGGRRRWMPSSR